MDSTLLSIRPVDLGKHNLGQSRYEGITKAWNILGQPPGFLNVPFSFAQRTEACPVLLKVRQSGNIYNPAVSISATDKKRKRLIGVKMRIKG